MDARTAFNYFRWISNYGFFFSFFYYIGNYGLKKIHYEIGFFGILFITENVIYAIKYAFFHPSKLNLIERFDMKHKPLSLGIANTIYDKQMVFEQSMKRLQIEPTSFHLYFMVAPNPEQKKRIQVGYPDNCNKLYVDIAANCISMAREIVEEYNKKCHIRFINKLSIFLALIRV